MTANLDEAIEKMEDAAASCGFVMEVKNIQGSYYQFLPDDSPKARGFYGEIKVRMHPLSIEAPEDIAPDTCTEK
jgi:hypothetical protein